MVPLRLQDDRVRQLKPHPRPCLPTVHPALTTLTPPLQPVATGFRHHIPGKKDGCWSQDDRAQCLLNGSFCPRYMACQWPPWPVCLPTQPKGSTGNSHQCGQSGRWQTPRYGQAGHSRSPHSLCQAPGHAATLNPVQGPAPAAVWPHLFGGGTQSVQWVLQTQDSTILSEVQGLPSIHISHSPMRTRHVTR